MHILLMQQRYSYQYTQCLETQNLDLFMSGRVNHNSHPRGMFSRRRLISAL